MKYQDRTENCVCVTDFNRCDALHRISRTPWACRSCMKPCLWAPWLKTGSCSSWLPSWALMGPWGTPAGAWTPSRTSCSSSSDLDSPPPHPRPPAEPKVGKQRDGFKQSSSSSSSSSSLSKLWHIWGGGRGDDEDCRNWCREMTESEWGDAKPRRSTQPCLALLLALCQTSVQPVFRKSWYWNSSRVILTLILLTGEEEEEEEEVHSEEDEDSRWDRRIKVCSRILWLTTATFTSCRWLRLWTFCLNVDLWRVLFKHIDSTVYNNVSCL